MDNLEEAGSGFEAGGNLARDERLEIPQDELERLAAEGIQQWSEGKKAKTGWK